MKKIKSEEISVKDIETNHSFRNIIQIKSKCSLEKICFFILSFLILIFIVNNLFLLAALKIKLKTNSDFFPNIDKKEIKITQNNKTNIDWNDEFFMSKEIREKIEQNNITFIETLSGGHGHIGNALFMLNNLINICEKIRCKNIISPGGLESIIKNPIFYREYNITIFPPSYRDKIKIDISVSKHFIFWFSYNKKPHEMRLKIIRDEVLHNVPKYNANPNDLYINIRSGDVFIKTINRMYSQPPLCFYRKIIDENRYNNIFILSNGHENPVVDKLLDLYPKIKYMHGTIEYDISIIINAFNLVMPISTFPMALIYLNINLRNIYIYPLLRYFLKDINFTVHKMQPSPKYLQIMERKWNKTEEQLNLMLTENCTSSPFESFSSQNLSLLYK